MTYQVSHSGGTWTSRGRGPGGNYIWPIEELFARSKHTPTVCERIRKFHPDGHEEGTIIRGWFHKPISWRRAKRHMQNGERVTAHRRKGGREIWNTLLFGRLAPEYRA